MTDLKSIIKAGEGLSVEFAHEYSEKDLARTISAMANTAGGQILIGVDKKGRIKGVFPKQELDYIYSIVKDNCDRSLDLQPETIQEGRHLILILNIPKESNKLKSLSDKQEWNYYHRIDSHDLPVNKIIFRLWHYQSIGDPSVEIDMELQDILDLFDGDEAISLSQIYRLSSLEKKTVNDLLAKLIYAKLIGYRVEDSLIVYFTIN